jgi:hypothetical protein
MTRIPSSHKANIGDLGEGQPSQSVVVEVHRTAPGLDRLHRLQSRRPEKALLAVHGCSPSPYVGGRYLYQRLPSQCQGTAKALHCAAECSIRRH